MTPQEQIAEAVRQRGYRDGYTPYQFLARNLVKMIEELAEAGSAFDLQSPDDVSMEATPLPYDLAWLNDDLARLGETARQRFDDRDPATWEDGIGHEGTDALAEELADIQVVLMNAAQAFADLRGEPYDVVAEAVKKATADTARGLRGQG